MQTITKHRMDFFFFKILSIEKQNLVFPYHFFQRIVAQLKKKKNEYVEIRIFKKYFGMLGWDFKFKTRVFRKTGTPAHQTFIICNKNENFAKS